MHRLSRRQYLASTAAAGMLGADSFAVDFEPARPGDATDGSHGLITEAGKSFHVRLQNTRAR